LEGLHPTLAEVITANDRIAIDCTATVVAFESIAGMTESIVVDSHHF
jgi:hypothetical protein